MIAATSGMVPSLCLSHESTQFTGSQTLAGAIAVRKWDACILPLASDLATTLDKREDERERDGQRQPSSLTFSGERGKFAVQQAGRGIKHEGPRQETRVIRKYSAPEMLD